MKAKEFGAWPPWNEGPGGVHSDFDAYNRALKGSERSPDSPEYSTWDIGEELNRWSETQDRTQEQHWQKPGKKQEGKSSKADAAKRSTRSRLLQQVVALTVGSTLIVTTYQADLVTRSGRPVDDGPAIVETVPGPSEDDGGGSKPTTASVSWSWDGSGGATATLVDAEGNVQTIPAQVTMTEEPSCTESGTRTYTASVTDPNGTVFQETRTETIPAAGHQFVQSEDAAPGTIRYVCAVCGEVYEITFEIEEED